MKKDIKIPSVTNIYVAAVLEQNKDQDDSWYIYLINNKNEMIEGVMITSRGYLSSEKGQEIVSSKLRHRIGNVPYKTAVKIELISPDVFEIFNEYWVTFFENNRIMEKKFTFGPHTIDKEFLEPLVVMDAKGILVK